MQKNFRQNEIPKNSYMPSPTEKIEASNAKPIVLAIVIAILGAGGYMAFTQVSENIAENEAIYSEAEWEEGSTSLTAVIGEKVEMQRTSLKINKIEEFQQLRGSDDTLITPVEGAKLVIINLDLISKEKDPFFASDIDFRLMDDQERTFEVYDNYELYLENNLLYESLSPSIPKTGVIVFEVPADALNYTLIVDEDAFAYDYDPDMVGTKYFIEIKK